MLDVLIVGSGFAGIGMAIALKREGTTSFRVLERAADLGGTWRDNRYPGCACDIPSMLYSFSFEPNPEWTRTYPPQAEIWRYLRHCSEKYGITPHISFNTEVSEAHYDTAASLWRVRTRDGNSVEARALVLGMGGLSNPLVPQLPGLASFSGPAFHSAQWDHSIDLSGKRIAVIGTGASAVQFVPHVARTAGAVTIFQRTPPWIIPRGDRATSPRQRLWRRILPAYAWLQRQAIYWTLEMRAFGFVVNTRLLAVAEGPARRHLARSMPDPELRAALTPHYRMGCKRVLLSDDYYPALRRSNVTLVTAPIVEVRPASVIDAGGGEHEVDAIIFGTGFRAQEFVAPAKIYGENALALDDAWREGPRSYLGISVAGFPNLFLLVGPNTGLGHNSMVVMIEAQIRYVMSALGYMRRRGIASIDVKPEVEKAFGDALRERTKRTVWVSGCRSWYLDAAGRNTALWPGFTFVYRWLTRRLAVKCYRRT